MPKDKKSDLSLDENMGNFTQKPDFIPKPFRPGSSVELQDDLDQEELVNTMKTTLGEKAVVSMQKGYLSSDDDSDTIETIIKRHTDKTKKE